VKVKENINITPPSDYNKLLDKYNALMSDYKTALTKIESISDIYKKKVSEYNTSASHLAILLIRSQKSETVWLR